MSDPARSPYQSSVKPSSSTVAGRLLVTWLTMAVTNSGSKDRMSLSASAKASQWDMLPVKMKRQTKVSINP